MLLHFPLENFYEALEENRHQSKLHFIGNVVLRFFEKFLPLFRRCILEDIHFAVFAVPFTSACTRAMTHTEKNVARCTFCNDTHAITLRLWWRERESLAHANFLLGIFIRSYITEREGRKFWTTKEPARCYIRYIKMYSEKKKIEKKSSFKNFYKIFPWH